MDWEISLIKLYLLIEKYYLSELWIYGQRFSNNNRPKFTGCKGINGSFLGII